MTSETTGPVVPSADHGGEAPLFDIAGDGVLDWFHARARLSPDAIAVDDGSRAWTYAEVNAIATDTARTLSHQIRPAEIAAVCLDTSAADVAVAIALAKLGVTYLPFGPGQGARRVQELTSRLGIGCLIGTRLGPASQVVDDRQAAPTPLPIPCREPVLAWTSSVPRVWHAPSGCRPLYGVFTSGSTGRPKVVLVGAASLAVLVRWCRSQFGLGPDDRISMLCAPSFDLHLHDLWVPLCLGATACVPPATVSVQDPAAIAGWWQQAGITVSLLPTPVAELVLDRRWPADVELRHLLIAGDRLRKWPPERVTAAVHNLYGPAEATVFCVGYHLQDDDCHADVPPIGRPVSGTDVYVTDETGRVVDRGLAGELLVGGESLSFGYDDPELTAERFVPAPGQVRGQADTAYRTGDMVRMRHDGVLEFLGRLDDQVKVSGVRVEPAEVEAVLERHAGVARAAVVPSPTPAGIRLHAFIRPVPGQRLDLSDVTERAKPWLAEQAVPATVQLVQDFPLTANGKIDRRALIAQVTSEPGLDNTGRSAESGGSAEVRAVLRICQNLLQQPSLCPEHNLIAAGASSLALAMLLNGIESEFGVRLRAAEVLRQPDLRAVARLVQARQGCGG